MKTQQESVENNGNLIELKVAGGSQSSKVAGAVVKYMQEGKKVSLIAMGAGAVNQMVKAICIARGMAGPYGWNLTIVPGFVNEMVDGVSKTAIRFYISQG